MEARNIKKYKEPKSLSALLSNNKARKRKLEEIIGETEDSQPMRKSIRIPSKNLLPNKKVYLKEEDNRGKHSKKKAEEEKIKLQNAGIRTTNDKYFSVDNCFNCGAFADSYFVRTKEYDVVCTKCGAVQDSEVVYEDEITTLSQTPTTNKKITYISERLRLFANREPRIASEDMSVIGRTYGQLISVYSENRVLSKQQQEDEICGTETMDKQKQHLRPLHLFRDTKVAKRTFELGAHYITKQFIRDLLRIVDKLDPEAIPRKTKSFEKKYTERWLQIKIYLMWGEEEFINSICPLPSKELLDKMVFKASLIVDAYEKQKDSMPTKKKNMLSIDLLFLLLLFQEGQECLITHGWYFVSSVLHRTYMIKRDKTNKSLEEDFQSFKKIFNSLNYSKKVKSNQVKGLILPEGGVRELIETASLGKGYLF